MTKEKKYLFYPYNDQSFPIIKALLSNETELDVVSPAGTALVNKDIACAVNRNKLNKTVKSIKEINYKQYHSLILSANTNFTLCETEIEELIACSRAENLEITYLGEDEKIIKILQSYNSIPPEHLKSKEKIHTIVKRFNELNLELFHSNTPIVYIGGLLETIDSLDIALQIKLELEKQSFKVSLITKEKNAQLFAANNYPPQFMGEKNAEEQILSINRWLQAVDYLEKPDIILMDIPKGMMQYNNSFHNSFGIYSHMIAQTIPPDYLILTIPPSFLATEYIEEINQHFKNTMGKNIDILNVTNIKHDTGAGITATMDKPLYIPEKEIDKLIGKNSQSIEVNLTNLNKKENIQMAIKDLLDKFS